MTKLLILGGTTEASLLARAVADRGVDAVFSYAGRVAAPKTQPVPTRIGGFGGVVGFANYIQQHNITHVVDATHPFAAQMSWNAYHGCEAAGVPLVAFSRPVWTAGDGDNWTHVANIDGAVSTLRGPARRVLLALGKQSVSAFASKPQHHYILRLVDVPQIAPDLPSHSIVVSRGPFDVAGDRALMQSHGVDLVICKNSGGVGAEAKLFAARELGVPVVMIDRPEVPTRQEMSTIKSVLDWATT
ncbi:cobalt-precorrin-6A reductase [Shimia sp. Alg240-R146]|uniref:cobalt-precorrin-6A reductase n=1 Tax=Shimia sp. Alg240-R146 TaxID=2993449 RepID=UPI0022E16F69|nr:cobalt-precorrin-6A reductase [Shimia sp. Alg240-R146]